MATAGGARTAGLEETLGALRPGFKADLVLFDLADPAHVPFNSAVRQLVYADSGRLIETVIVNGRVPVRDRRLASVDETALHEEIRELMPALRADFDRLLSGYGKLRPHLDEVQRRALPTPLSIHRYVGAPQTDLRPADTAPASNRRSTSQ